MYLYCDYMSVCLHVHVHVCVSEGDGGGGDRKRESVNELHVILSDVLITNNYYYKHDLCKVHVHVRQRRITLQVHVDVRMYV